MDFGKAVRESRRSLRLTQAELATRAKVSRQAIVLLEKNRGRVSTLVAVKPHVHFRVTHIGRGNTLGEQVRETRAKKRQTQASLARSVGVSVNTVRAIESGRGSVDRLSRVIAILTPKARIVVEHLEERKPRSFATVAGKPNRNRDPSDHYPTPAPIIRLLLDHEDFTREQPILEPAVGRARVIEKVLHERGYADVICYDLHGVGSEQRDFFDIVEPHHTIITNPPFRAHQEFIVHAKTVATAKIALLLPLNHLTGAQRHTGIWTDREFPLARIYVLNRGISFTGSDPFADRFQSSQMYCAWYIFEKEHIGDPAMKWIDNHKMIARGSRSGA